MNINLYKKYFLILLPMLYSCSQDTYVSKYDHLKKIKNPAYETCLNDANYNIENLQNINQDKIDILQTDDTMVDFYNIDNDIDKINLSKKRNKMINECMKRRYKK
mgnify:CR=1 FL=1|tara:strand:+ start:1618 stop:1932 length:315 start_codon:yes stop_codon:yes gene_type:complete